MRGGEWIVPVVVLIVWVISTIMKSREEEPVRARKPASEPGRKPTGDIDKFLEEIDRLRRKSAEEQGRVVRPAPPPPPRVRPVAQAPRPKPAARLEPAVSLPPVVERVPVNAPVLSSRTSIGPAVDLRPPIGPKAAFHLLRSPRTLASAVVLQEVLGPPKCRRRS
jgi:hypothetical protein